MGTLSERFEEIIHMTWSEFRKLEKDKHAIVDDSALCSLIRLCADTDDIAASKMAFDRLDGLQEVPIQINIPKFYIRYINAKDMEDVPKELGQVEDTKAKTTYDPATAKLRQTLVEMRTMPKGIVNVVRAYKKAIDEDKPTDQDPMVKSVIVANLLRNVRKGRFKAIELVFDQIDGKLTRTISLLGGEDVYIDDYNTLTAPGNSTKDENGYYIAEDKKMTTHWLRGFANSSKGLEMLAEGLDDE